MARDLDFQHVTVRISNHFEGPNFVNGLAIQDASYTLVSEERARVVRDVADLFNPEIDIQIET